MPIFTCPTGKINIFDSFEKRRLKKGGIVGHVGFYPGSYGDDEVEVIILYWFI